MAVYTGVDGDAIALPAAMEGARPEPIDRIGTLFDCHHQRLYRLARRMSRSADDARDIVQETFLRAARSAKSIPFGAPHEEAWLTRVLVNICRDRWRHSAVHSRAAAEGHVGAASPARTEPGLLAHAMVWQALDRLPPRRRAVLILYELEGTAIPAIAKLLGVTPVTVRWHLSIGRREMARVLGGQP